MSDLKVNGNTINLTGQRFGKLTVIQYDHSDKNGAHWLCQCDCGNRKVVSAHCLKIGHALSCGCLCFSANNHSKERLYTTWHDMLRRCFVPKCKSYPNYGGRGITVCNEWRNDYMAFKNWAMQNGYTDSLTIDRIDSDGNYEPSNCRWVTMKVQENNTRKNWFIECNGISHTVAEWADILGIPYTALRSRLKRGWSLEKAFSKPVQQRINSNA